MAKTYRSIQEIDFNSTQFDSMPLPNTALMVHPSAFDVVYSINPHMDEHIGNVEKALAIKQWEFLRDQYESMGLRVSVIEGVDGLPDMVFCANQSLPELSLDGKKRVYMSNMRHPQRADEVGIIRAWYKKEGFEVMDHANSTHYFEGMGDAIWHLGKRLLWGGYGYRTHEAVYEEIAAYFDVPVLLLELKNPSLYHLDTCLSVLNAETALIYPGAFTDEGLELIHHFFPKVIQTNEKETMEYLACNAVCPDAKHVIIEERCEHTIAQIKEHGFEVVKADTSEYLKSGGSVFCMKMLLWND